MDLSESRPSCKRCNAPLPPHNDEGQLHDMCEMIEQMESEECVNCGSGNAEFTIVDSNLVQYHEGCGHAALNPHKDNHE